MAYSNPTNATPPCDPPPAPGSGGADNYGWQGQASAPPQQPNPPYQQYQPYGQQYAQPGAYYAGPMAPATSGYAIASLVCSLLGFVGVLGFGPILGVVFGHMAIREIDRSNGHLQGRGLAQAGLILGYIGIGLVALFILLFLVIFIASAGAVLVAPNG